MLESDVEAIRDDFPALKRIVRGRPIVYFDNACTTLRPRQVIEAVARFQGLGAACHGRSYHLFGREATDALSAARESVKRFINARHADEIIFVRNTTEAINFVAYALGLREGARVLTSDLEHNSNFLPWQRLAISGAIRLDIVPLDPEEGFDLDLFRKKLPGADLVSTFHISNVCGIENPVYEICREAHEAGALVLLDGAQAPCSVPIDVQAIGADFYAFSLHKMFGPTGIGVLFVRREVLPRLKPLLLGGHTVKEVSLDGHMLEEPPARFEAGVANLDGAVGAKAAIEYVQAIGVERMKAHVARLNTRATLKVLALGRARLIGPESALKRGAILNFFLEGLDSLAVARVLDEASNVMVRAGRHCAHAWYQKRRLQGSIRVSFAVYNTEDEVDIFAETLGKIVGLVA